MRISGPGSGRPDLAALREDAGRVLDHHVLDKWFPRAVDPEGGFHQDFASDWSRIGGGDLRSLVYQARLTWTAAAASARRPGLATTAGHGLAFVADRLWDTAYGGFLWSVERAGAPAGAWAEEKHSYGQAFAIYAAATAHGCGIGDGRALDLAQKGFEWLDRYARDRDHGGYVELVARDGGRVGGAGRGQDSIGTPYGLKSSNTHLHVMEALIALHAVWPAPAVEAALAETLALTRTRLCASRRGAPPYFTPDWTPLSRAVSFGHDVEAAHLVMAAAGRLGEDEVRRTLPLARRLVDEALAGGRDRRRGGLFHGRSAWLGRLDRTKTWWAQAEALAALDLMHRLLGDETPVYARRLEETWRFVRAYQLDPDHGGWIPRLDADNRPRPGPKSDSWTDPYHQARALLMLTAL